MNQRHEWAKRLCWLLLLLILGLMFGWRVAAALLALCAIGYVAFWLFMLLKPVKQDYLLPQPRDHEPPPVIRQELGAASEKASLGKIGHHD
jgi:predicted MFS family arabinose efflux permease